MSSSHSPPDSSPAAEVPLAPGFRFHPTDEELVSYYLRRRVLGRRLRVDAIAEVDLYRLEPWDLPSLSRIRSRDSQWYFFTRLDRKITGAGAGGRGGPGNRTNRATQQGYWKTTGKDREVYHRGKPVGMKKTLVFHNGRAPKGARTNWVMHEYRLLDADGPQDLHVVCRVFQKLGSGPQNGAQYGAPYMEEEWDEDDAIESEAATGASAKVAATSDTADEESNEEDENAYCKTNELAQAQETLNPPEMAALQAPQGLNQTSDGSCDGGAISLEEILSSTVSAENIGGPEGQIATDDNFSVADFSGCPTKDDCFVAQDGTMNWSDPANGECTNWPLRAYSNQNPANGTLSADEFFDTGNGTDDNEYSGQQQICQSDYHQNLNLQADGFVAPRQVDDSMVFYDAPPSWGDGNDDLYLSDLLSEPLDNSSLFAGDDLMEYFIDAPEDGFKYDMLGSVEGSDYQLTEMSNFAQKGDKKDMSTFDGISKTSAANGHYGASSSVSHEDLYPDTTLPVDVTADKTFGKRLVNMLGSIPAPPAMASEHPPTTGKSVLTGGSPPSIHVTTGIIQLGSLSFTGSERGSLQKNGNFSLLLSFTMESDATSKSTNFEPATQVGAAPMVMRGGLYLFFVSAMILMLSYKVGSCIYSR